LALAAIGRLADLEIGDTAGLETCGTAFSAVERTKGLSVKVVIIIKL
jgi:hypothetical protein